MAYKSKEKYPLVKNPNKWSYCSVDPARGVPCRVHFHREDVAKLKKLDLNLPEPPPVPGHISANLYSDTIAGFKRTDLMNGYGLTAAELYRIETFPANSDLPDVASEANEVWLSFQDPANRKLMSANVQAAAVVEHAKSLDAALRKAQNDLQQERLNPEYPGNRNVMSDQPKSRKYYELLDVQNRLMSDIASSYITAADALGWREHSNEGIRNALMVAPSAASTFQQNSEGVDVTVWSAPVSNLMYAVDAHARQPHVAAEYGEAKNKYANIVYQQNKSLTDFGTNFRVEKIAPSAELVEARLQKAIQERQVIKAREGASKAGIFNRNRRIRELQAEEAKLEEYKNRLNILEGS